MLSAVRQVLGGEPPSLATGVRNMVGVRSSLCGAMEPFSKRRKPFLAMMVSAFHGLKMFSHHGLNVFSHLAGVKAITRAALAMGLPPISERGSMACPARRRMVSLYG